MSVVSFCVKEALLAAVENSDVDFWTHTHTILETPRTNNVKFFAIKFAFVL